MTPRYETEKRGENIEGGFFSRLFSFGKEGSKKRTFRQLKKQLASCKMDIYRLKQDSISVSFARALFEIYRLTGPLRQLVPLEKGDNKLPYAYVEAFIHYYQSETGREIAEKLNEIGTPS